MTNKLLKIAEAISKINFFVGRGISYVLIGMLFSVIYDVIMRYVLNSPSIWSNEISQYLLVVISMLGGAYCLAGDGHVRVDIIYHTLPERYRKYVEILNTVLILIVAIAMTVKGSILCYEAFIEDKRSNTILAFPLLPSMLMVPLGAILLGIQAISNVITCFAKKDETIDAKGKT